MPRPLKVIEKMPLDRINNIVTDKDMSILEEINAIEEGLYRPQVPMQSGNIGLLLALVIPPVSCLDRGIHITIKHEAKEWTIEDDVFFELGMIRGKVGVPHRSREHPRSDR